jgi:hypothetical protein
MKGPVNTVPLDDASCSMNKSGGFCNEENVIVEQFLKNEKVVT